MALSPMGVFNVNYNKLLREAEQAVCKYPFITVALSNVTLYHIDHVWKCFGFT